jgi:uncharacterized membrane protein
MNYRRLIIGILLSTIFYLVGRWVSSIYGFDPPYFLYYLGQGLIILSIITLVILAILLMIKITKRLLNKNAP